MGTTSSATNSLSTPVTFNGQSTFSSSFQQVLQRAVSVASLPMQQVQTELETLQAQQSTLQSLQSTFSSLQTALQGISSAMTGDVSASSSDDSVVEASAQSTTLPGTYTVQVDTMGSSTSTISDGTAVTDPTSQNISSSLNYTLTVNGTPTTLTLTSDNLDSLATAINNANVGVSATIVNLGSNSSPNYQLAVTSNELGDDTIQLSDGTNNSMLSVVGEPGQQASYQVNGSSTVLYSNSNQVTLAPGLTATLVSAAPTSPVTITVASSENNLSSALSNFATAYNAANSAVQQQTGQNGSAIAGESLVYELQNALGQMAQVTSNSGSVHDLSDLGLDLDSSGNLTFDSSQFSGLSADGITQYLGGLTSGGFLETANNILSSLADPTSGMITTEYNNLASEVTNDDTQISNDQTNVNNLEANLQQQLSAADASIATLQSQNSFYSNLFQTENANNMAGLS